MQCIRCGNTNHSGPFPFCNRCELCPTCYGRGVDISGNGHPCELCKGKGFLVKKKFNGQQDSSSIQ